MAEAMMCDNCGESFRKNGTVVDPEVEDHNLQKYIISRKNADDKTPSKKETVSIDLCNGCCNHIPADRLMKLVVDNILPVGE